jgi:DNA-binding LacI/PurR family transcriptional regulator
MRATIIDIAKEAGVSKSTVSLVINKSTAVKPETREKVLRAIEKLGYVPNMAARELITNKSNIIGLVFLTENDNIKPYSFDSVAETLFYDTFNYISQHLRYTDYTLLSERFSAIKNPEELPELIKNGRISGLLLIGGLFQKEFIDHVQKNNIPVVIIGRQYEGINSVSVDFEDVGKMAAEYLIKTGHRNIAFINGPEHSINSKLKYNGFLKAFKKNGLNFNNKYLKYSSYIGRSGYESMRSIWESGIRPDAIFGASDGITIGAMNYLYDIGIRVPNDISVIGYEDSILTEYASPPLTVIDGNKEKIVFEACSILKNCIKDPSQKVNTKIVKPLLIERNSVKNRKETS